MLSTVDTIKRLLAGLQSTGMTAAEWEAKQDAVVVWRKVTITYWLGANVRSAPNTGSAKVLRTMKKNDTAETTEDVTVDVAKNKWIKIADGYVCVEYYGSVRANVEIIDKPTK